MLRKEKVYRLLYDECSRIKTKDIKDDVGFSAEYIASKLNLTRNNVSADLNALYREGRVYKIEGRPTLYLTRDWADEHGITGSKPKSERSANTINMDIFSDMVGHDGSLLPYIKQAQAAMLYPPKGLATLLLGETGVGKTTFAEHMYLFARANGVIKEDAPYVVFNCADYSNNPQLLMSILFGSAKGAYTGSDVDRVGLVEKAGGGILFLDEVHRLPPEGQEMLFNIIDRGLYRRLGEVSERKADIIIIAATTRDPRSALLETFLRRFPIMIKLPSLKERGLAEKLEIISDFFNKEAERVKRPIKVARDVMLSLLLYKPSGNVGELKSDIERISSRGYLDYLINQDEMRITLSHLPESIREAILTPGDEKRSAEKLLKYGDYVFDGASFERQKSERDPYDFSMEVYEYLDEKSREYRGNGLSKGEMTDRLLKDLEEVFLRYREGILSIGIKEQELARFLSADIISSVKVLSEEVLKKFNYHIKEDTLIALAFHINSMFVRKNKVNPINLDDIKSGHPVEYGVASYMVERLKSLLKRDIPTYEAGFISMILYLTNGEERPKKIGVMVIAHGEGTATGMADVANKLLRTDHVKAIDMSLDDNPEDILERAIGLAKDIDEGKGILLMVDMGSLKVFGEEIEKRTGINTITIDNVSTPALIEAAHRSMLPYSTLRDVARAVLDLTRNLIAATSKEVNGSTQRERVIFTVCSTGEGTAMYLKEVIERALKKNNIEGVDVIEINISDRKKAVENMKRIAAGRQIAAIAGSINPEMPGVPFINLMEFVTGNGLERVLRLISGSTQLRADIKDEDRTVVYGAIMDALDENLNFLSGKKLMPFLDKYARMIEKEKDIKLDNHKYTLFTMHMAYAIERFKFASRVVEGALPPDPLIRTVYEDFGVTLESDELKIIEEIIK
jgi:PRD domain./PTS system, Lactose/Cellobiose specific IIB subunit./Sigma-54 interaction domain./PTS system fructose IIA component.